MFLPLVAIRPLSLLTKIFETHGTKDLMAHFLSLTTKSLEQLRTSGPVRVSQAAASTNETSRCTVTDDAVICSRKDALINTGIWLRGVLWEVPVGTPPAAGWPVVLHFQGSFFAPHLFSWTGSKWMPFGAYHQTLGIKTLLDAGYAVITPESHLNGFTFWDTNIPPYSILWSIAPDHFFMEALIKEIANPGGLFGHLNLKAKYATGISSGGYMTSRMAVSYPGEFRSLVVTSGSYATCAGPVCIVPRLPRDHPPTLFLHGGSDLIVPQFTMEAYYDELVKDGIPTEKQVVEAAGHEWWEGSHEHLVSWFRRYP